MRRNEDGLSELGDNTKCANTALCRAPRRKRERERAREGILRDNRHKPS